MKKLVTLALLLITSAAPAFADHIGIYRDATGQSCRLDPGYNNNATIIHKYSLGATGSEFRVDFSQAPGSTFIAFHSPFVSLGDLTTGIAFAYGGRCLTGNIVVGTIEATLIAGSLQVTPRDGFWFIMYAACATAEYTATGGTAIIGFEATGNCNDPTATEQSSWGRVKALYRD
jgi:hypothetical protein